MPLRQGFTLVKTLTSAQAGVNAIGVNSISIAGVPVGACLLDARQEEGFHASEARLRGHAGHIPEEGRARLPVPVIQEGDHGRQQEVIAQPAWHQ